jgi:glutamyl-tRNA reductase
VSSLGAAAVTHWTTPLSTLESVFFPTDEVPQRLVALVHQPLVTGAAILSTCNRTELYASFEGDPEPGILLDFLADDRGVESEALESVAMLSSDGDVARHLFRVVTGLDSVAQGETEILRQVREAFLMARAEEAASPLLDGLFRWAIKAGKRARKEAPFGTHPPSLGRVAVDVGAARLGSLAGANVLIVGAGKIAKAVAQWVPDTAQLRVCSRTIESAQRLAGRRGRALTLGNLRSALKDADLVVVAVSSPKHLVGEIWLREAVALRGRPLVLIDLSIPRSVEPSIRDIDGATLLDLDDLRHERALMPSLPSGVLRAAEDIVDQELAHFLSWAEGRKAAPVVAALRRRAEDLCASELERALRGHIGEERELIEGTVRAVVAKLLHSTTLAAKKAVSEGDGTTVELLSRIFSLEVGDERTGLYPAGAASFTERVRKDETLEALDKGRRK